MQRLKNLFRRPATRHTIAPATFGTGATKPARDHPGWLALAAAAVILLPKVPYGNYVLYPFTILTTWFHEMGHGLTALLLGLSFDRLVIFPDGSGYALTLSPLDTSAVTYALVSAGGPLGPAIAGSLMILASPSAKWRRIALAALGLTIILSLAVWVRSLIGWAVLLPVAALIGTIAYRANESASRFAVQFLGIHAAISMFGQWGYLFSSGAVIGGNHQSSDTGAIAQHLLLPHWFWAGVIMALGGLMIAASLYRVIAKTGNER